MHNPVLLATSTALPPVQVTQPMAREYASHMFEGKLSRLDKLLGVFDHAEIETRYVCEPPEWWTKPKGFAEKNNTYIHWATKLAEEVSQGVFDQSGVSPDVVDAVIFTSSTGLSTPSIDARLVDKLGLNPHVRRMPLWGLGCAGGAMGLARARDFIAANPSATVLVIAVELCSLTFLFHDFSIQNLVALALFGDGAAAVLLRGDGEGPRLKASRGTTWPSLADAAGWTILDEGMQVVFARELPGITRDHAGGDIMDFLQENDKSLADIDHFIFHPGGVKVMEAYEEALGLPSTALDRTKRIMRRIGNVSSPTVLFVLDDLLRDAAANSGTALIHALGPGFSSENLLLEIG